MLKQAGVVRVENTHQMFDVAQVLQEQPLPAGKRVGIVGNSDALAALVADAAISWGLELGAKPVSLRPDADAAEFRHALERVFATETVDSVVATFIPPLATVDEDVVHALVDVAGGSEKTCVACFLGMRGVGPDAGSGETRVVPAFPTPEDAVRALAAVTEHAQWRMRPQGQPVAPAGTDPARADEIVDKVLSRAAAAHPAGLRLSDEETTNLLSAYGIRLWPSVLVKDADSAVEAAEKLGWPVVLKAAAENLRHRREMGGVRLDIASASELRRQIAAVKAEVGDLRAGYLIQRMAPPGISTMIRSIEDALFGPVVTFGLSGDASDLLGDVAHRIPPLTDVDVSDLVRSVKASPRLFGYRGSPHLDVPGLEDVIARVSRLADDLPEIAELELNPVLVSQDGVAVLGAKVRVARPGTRTDSGVRRAPTT
jgi:acyl-CoA synthetase (NDP forming)